MDITGNYEERIFPHRRVPALDILALGRTRNHVPILLEIDVTKARARFHNHAEQTGQRLSFTGWIVHCVAQAASEHKHIHALRQGTRKLVLFDDVDVTVVIERAIDARTPPTTLAMPYVLRTANTKTVEQIHAEIRAAKAMPVPVSDFQVDAQRMPWLVPFFTTLPRFVRHLLVWHWLKYNPWLVKRLMGTVIVSSIGMFGKNGISWAVPIGVHALSITVGGIGRRPAVVDDTVVIREHLGLTVMFDHDVTDGAPAARFAQRLKELMECGYGLQEC